MVRNSMVRDPDVIVIGAGAAGLAAASLLGHSGLSVLTLEARDRIGGRIFTQRDPAFDAPIELGAEFIHGRPRELWDLFRQCNVTINEVDGDGWCVTDGRLAPCIFFNQVDEILDEMDDRTPDESFLEFLQRCCAHPTKITDENAKERALAYVTGFNAADPSLVGVHWLIEEMRAEERIDGERAFRPENGYEDLVEIFRRRLADAEVALRTGNVVDRIQWERDHIEVTAHDGHGSSVFSSARVLVTLPLEVLKTPVGQAGAIEFAPALPPPKLAALNLLEMGKVIRVVLRFRHRFWDNISPAGHGAKTLSDMSFLFSQDEWFPTWWTSLPAKLPIITGWAPFRSAERLSGRSRSFVVDRSLKTLAEQLQISAHQLENEFEAAYFHDWQNDPFSRGAYSYGKVGADGAQRTLAAPLENSLFFAGEATEVSGHNGTVHGAIASGYRAATEILQGLA